MDSRHTSNCVFRSSSTSPFLVRRSAAPSVFIRLHAPPLSSCGDRQPGSVHSPMLDPRRWLLHLLYFGALFFSVPLSLAVWYVRREFIQETSVAGYDKASDCFTSDKSVDLSRHLRPKRNKRNTSKFASLRESITKMQVVIIHPEQWNGGSDRCTVALINHFVAQGHQVIWLTTMIDDYWKDHKFEGVEIRDIGLRLHPGDWWSQNVALGWHLVLSDLNPDLCVIDHSASCVPMIKYRFPSCKVLFYCHFPQQLVTPSRLFLYRWYSSLIGLLESLLFEKSDIIMVNSQYTASQFSRVMPNIDKEKIRVVYPPCDVDSITISAEPPVSRRCRPQNPRYIFLSMNRFWPEKRLDIIVEAASILKKRGCQFVVQLAGSVMPHIPESRIYYDILQKMAKDLDVEDVVEFVPSPSEDDKFALYRQCDSALYTPPNEHFGIVPIEALDQRRPVIVCDSGGPAETVIEDVTGSKIAHPTGELLADAMMHHMKKTDWPALDCDTEYQKQRARFERDFSQRGFCAHIDEAIAHMFPGQSLPGSRRALA